MSSVSRILSYIEFEKIKKSDFYKKTGLSNGYLDKVKELGSDKIESIISVFPTINLEWLVTGKGKMVKSDFSDSEIIKSPLSKGIKKGVGLIPYYEVDFAAGGVELASDGTTAPAYYMDIPEFRGCSAFRAYSDSMESLIKSGNIIFGRKIEDWQTYLEYGQVYGITMLDGRRHLKYIRKAKEDKKNFLLKSENKEYDDFEIPKTKVKNIWLIEGWLNRRS